ncbi:unnamed protein product, partial [Chrysoparadoxa australica]
MMEEAALIAEEAALKPEYLVHSPQLLLSAGMEGTGRAVMYVASIAERAWEPHSQAPTEVGAGCAVVLIFSALVILRYVLSRALALAEIITKHHTARLGARDLEKHGPDAYFLKAFLHAPQGLL